MGEGIERERDFWDHEVPDLASCLDEMSLGPDPFVGTMLDALGDVDGKVVLDFACGAGMTSARLAQRGARVIALDASPVSLRRTSEVAQAMGVADRVTTVASFDEVERTVLGGAVGRYALHHVDVADVAARISGMMATGAVASFVETFELNPVLRLSRRHLVGRRGIPRYGTVDEHPLTRRDLDDLREAFGSLEMAVPQVAFLRIFDRQVLRARYPVPSRCLAWLDDRIGSVRRLQFLSYHQVIVCRKA